MRRWTLLGLLLAAACGSATDPEVEDFGSGAISGSATGSGAATTTISTSATTGGRSNGSSGSGTFGASGAAGSGSSGTSGNGSSPASGTSLTGALAFTPTFSGEFYGLYPDGGADLSNLDCRIADGTDLASECVSALLSPDAGANAEPDGGSGGSGGAQSRHILDIFVTSTEDVALASGNAAVTASSDVLIDAGAFATIELTLLRDDDGGPVGGQVLSAYEGSVAYQATPAGMTGTFSASFVLWDGGLGTVSGTFGADYCAPLDGY